MTHLVASRSRLNEPQCQGNSANDIKAADAQLYDLYCIRSPFPDSVMKCSDRPRKNGDSLSPAVKPINPKLYC
ncbi:hypothetical protein IQ268_01545 [Oculatella sp. LEGE 06141]|uniref:hypothetical protein n=1 Tax=Oculatella sp. LEGE 06141 TaxID=1828648 RepID=UPI00187E5CD1|nr:hypothetical protein [Oculatella sp. LEGE 06141]MBE9177257.1 hypothetical protein [Oculatella sp. LEGE 06141]